MGTRQAVNFMGMDEYPELPNLVVFVSGHFNPATLEFEHNSLIEDSNRVCLSDDFEKYVSDLRRSKAEADHVLADGLEIALEAAVEIEKLTTRDSVLGSEEIANTEYELTASDLEPRPVFANRPEGAGRFRAFRRLTGL
jgi:hypothetical protein